MNGRFAILLAILPAAWVSLAPAQAWAKPKVAILGLELVDTGEENSQIIRRSAEVARLLSERLREQAKARYSPYSLAPNSQRDLLEMKLLSSCSEEQVDCMTGIGKEFKASVLIYGRLERKAPDGYVVVLYVLKVKEASVSDPHRFTIPFNESRSNDLRRHARRIYKTVSGVKIGGGVRIKVSNATSGAVFLDDEPVSPLVGGELVLEDVDPGKHTIRVEAPGYEPYREEVKVVEGRTAALDLTLTAKTEGGPDPIDTGESDRDPRRTDKIIFWSATAATAAAAGVWAFSGVKVLKAEDDVDSLDARLQMGTNTGYQNAVNMGPTQGDACGSADVTMDVDTDVTSLRSACDDGKKFKNIANGMIISTGVFAAVAAYFGYRAYIRKQPTERKESPGSITEPAEPEVSLEPYIGPDVMGAGMTVRF